MAKTMDTRSRVRTRAPAAEAPRRSSWAGEIYHSAIGKKYAMAISGVVLLAYVLLHAIGNLKLYFGEAHMNEYAGYLRTFGEPAVPYGTMLWTVRIALVAAFAIHIVAAYQLTMMNRRARPERYRSRRDYVVAGFASRTMRWTGVIVGLFVLFHLADLTWGYANPAFEHGEVYSNVVQSFSRLPVAILYVVANLALGLHLYHGVWSMFQTMGWNRPRFNRWRRWFSIAFAVAVAGVNISFPVAVVTGVVS